MQSIQLNKHIKSHGFTMIEVLIIAPIAIIAISGFVALMTSMIGDILVTRDQNNLIFSTQDATARIEDRVRLSLQMLDTTGTLESPQGINDDTTPFTSQNTLVLNSVATDENPSAPDRWMIYYASQPNPCGDSADSNRIFTYKSIFYLKDNALWERHIVPEYNMNQGSPDENTICALADYPPWQKNTCTPGLVASICESEDARVLDNVESFQIDYYSSPDSTTPILPSQAPSATTVKVTINTKKDTAGREISSTASIRASKMNNISND